ncbi:MAG TPA: helix-turn-helix domain-containing protein, partial [Acidobacteriota bacterium]|nr:helix-turn-helix domain-containing protein [Acidobacteriota bacterium]
DYSAERLLAQPDDDAWRLSSLERKAIVDALRITGGNKTTAAELLGVSRRAFYEKMKRHNID